MINRKHKDRLFSFIFGREENRRWTLALYNAVNRTNYTDPEEITINTINDAVYMGMNNDVSFIIRSFMNLYAHQNTYNPNMPLREFMYAALLYDKYIHQIDANIYSTKIVKIPVPRLVVFYNGTTEKEDEVILELRESFPAGIDPDISDIQVRVRMLNINYGRNRELMETCHPLVEYSWFVDEIRKNVKAGMDIETAVDTALDSMPKNYEIKPFLIANKAEVRLMCITEYDEEKTMQLFKKEAREEAREERDKEKIKEMLDDGKTPDAISDFCKYPIELILQVQESMTVAAQ